MEDRNLFKAKRLDNGEWVTGSLITCEDGTCKIATSCLEGKADEPMRKYGDSNETLQTNSMCSL